MTAPPLPSSNAPPPNPPAANSSGTPTGSSPTEFRFQPGAGVPDWAVGKTASEVLQITTQLAETVKSVQPAAKPTPTNQAGLPSIDDYTMDPVKAAQQQLEYNFAQRVAPVFQRYDQQLASAARTLAQTTNPDEFKRWGPEIDQMVATVPAEQRTADLYTQAVRIVKANHLDEIANERAERRLAELGVTDRTSGGGTNTSGPSATVVTLDKLDPAYKAALEKMGIGERELDEFLAKTHQTKEQFIESANRRQVITDVSWDHKGRSQVQVGLDQLYGGKVPIKEW